MMRPAGRRHHPAPTRATIAFAVVALLHAGCGASTPSAADAEPSAPVAEPAAPAVVCGALPTGDRLTQFAGAVCPWVAVLHDGEVRISSAEPQGDVSSAGPFPDACLASACDVRGVTTPVGPLLVVEHRGTQSEVPQGVWIGHRRGDALEFVDLWEDAGDDVFDGGVALGPAHALAPFSCDGELAWFAAPRTVAGETLEPPSQLRAREGAAIGERTPIDRAACQRLAVALP